MWQISGLCGHNGGRSHSNHRDKWSNVKTNCGRRHPNFRGQGTKQAPQRQEQDTNAMQ